MIDAIKAGFESWSFPVQVTLALLLPALVYFRGWRHLRRAFPQLISLWHLAAFVSGLCALWLAIGSPLTTLDDDFLTFHMVQHLLLMAVAPPLILLGAPALPLLHGLPRRLVRVALGPLLHCPPVLWLGSVLTRPAVCWLAATGAVIGWHVPALFELALRSQWWHEVEHACFFTTGLLFWWPVVQPWPSVARCPRWSIPLYLFLATLPCDALSAFLTFCDGVVYPSYQHSPHISEISALGDQEFAGALMWIAITFIYLVPAIVVTVRLLSPSQRQIAGKPHTSSEAEVG